jgi:hypothetical protein
MTDRDENFTADDLALIGGADAGSKQQMDTGTAAAGDDGKQATTAAPGQARSETLVDEVDRDKDGYVPPKKDGDSAADGDWRKGVVDYTLGKLKGKVPEDQLAKRSAAMMSVLKRYGTEKDFAIGGFAAMEKIRSGEYRAKPPAEASAEDLAAWREENGIPAKPEGYDVPKIAGYKWTDSDKPLIENFKTFAHKAAYSQEQVNAGAEWYVKTVQEAQEKYWADISQTDNADKEIVKDQLRTEYGPSDYKPSIVLLDRLLNDAEVMPNSLGQSILTARYTDAEGRSKRLINSPDMARLLINYAKDSYGEGSFITGDAKTSMTNRKKEIEKVMNEDYDRYWRDGMADEYAEILAQEEKASPRRRSAA